MSSDSPTTPPFPAVPDPSIGLPQFDHAAPPDPVEQGLRQGLRYTHVWTSQARAAAWTTRVGMQTLIELLVAKGVITEEEFESQKAEVGPAVEAEFSKDPYAPLISGAQDKYDSYSPPIDCETRIHLCQARCCTFRFALSAQDLDEGVVRWDYARPYLNAQRTDGYCTHCTPVTFGCNVYQHRPAVCRRYDCRNDKRIWEDFEARIPARRPVAEAPAATP